jgi:hypothetical protein
VVWNDSNVDSEVRTDPVTVANNGNLVLTSKNTTQTTGNE